MGGEITKALTDPTCALIQLLTIVEVSVARFPSAFLVSSKEQDFRPVLCDRSLPFAASPGGPCYGRKQVDVDAGSHLAAEMV